jgi:hypothetical protein
MREILRGSLRVGIWFVGFFAVVLALLYGLAVWAG